MSWNPYRHCGSVIGIALCAILPAAPSPAATIHVPPVTVTQLTHRTFSDGRVNDGVNFPQTTCGRGCCYWITECAGSGFTTNLYTAMISMGDVVTVRIQAPAGKEFVVHAPPGGLGHFFATAYWQPDTVAGTISSSDPSSVAFENLQGAPPSEDYSFVALGDQHQIVTMHKTYVYTSAFEFTAYVVRITAASASPPVEYKYNIFGGWSDPSFGASAYGGDPHLPLMEIVDIATPAERTTWGRIKVLYR